MPGGAAHAPVIGTTPADGCGSCVLWRRQMTARPHNCQAMMSGGETESGTSRFLIPRQGSARRPEIARGTPDLLERKVKAKALPPGP